MASPKPAVIVRREFEATPDVVAQQLRACIVGPSCQLVRYANASEKGKGFVAAIASNTAAAAGTDLSLMAADVSYSIPSLAATSVFDVPYTKVFIENAYVTYAHIIMEGGGAGWTAQSGANSLVAGGTTAWKGTGRMAGLVQDVAVGDIIQLYTAAGGLQHTSTVTGFTAATGSAAIGAIGLSSAANIASAAFSFPATIGTATFTGSGAAYLTGVTEAIFGADPRIVGKLTTTYVLTVTANTSTTVSYTVVSDTGLDNLTVTAATYNASASALISGLTVQLAFTSGNPPVVGSTGTFTATAAHTKQTFATTGSPDYVVGGTLTAATPGTTYQITCIRGGSSNPAVGNVNKPQFKVYTNNGADAPGNFTLLGTTAAINIGTFSLTLTPTVGTTTPRGFVRGDTISIAVTAAAAGAITTVTFADAVPAAIAAGSNTNRVRLSKLKTVQVPSEAYTVNWNITDAANADLRKFKLENIVTIYDSAVNNGLTPAYVTAGKVYLQYRSFLAIPREVGSVNTLADITTQLGSIDPDNLLAYGVYKAWSNANGARVHFIPTVTQTLNGVRGFADALALAKGNRNCYGLVPLSDSAEVWAAFVGHAKDESAPEVGRFRVVWIAPEVAAHNKVYDLDSSGAVITVTQAGSATVAGVSWQIDTATSTKFTEAVQVGDFVRQITGYDALGNASYKEFKVLGVLDNNSLLIATAVDPALSNTTIEIYRDLTSSALAAKYAAVAGGFSSERVFSVVTDRGVNGLRVDGVPVKNWYIACAFAGLRAGSRPQQPLSNVELTGFDGVNISTPAFDETDLDTLRDGGVWAVRNTEDGKVYVERQLSTSTLDLFRKEQSVTCNVDSISFTLADALRTLVGRVNITEKTKGLVEAIIEQTLGLLSATNGAITVGPQLNSYTIVSVTVPATAQDTLLVKIQIAVPLPMNVIDITLVI